MSSRRSGAESAARAVPSGGGRPHHLSSVVHHFLSDVEPDSTLAPGEPRRVVVTGSACPDLVMLASRGLGESATEIEWRVLEEEALEHLEGLARAGGSGLAGPSDLVWCLPLASATALKHAQVLGRWVRVLGCRRVEVLLSLARYAAVDPDLASLRRLASLVAPGVPVGITVSGPDRWPAACSTLARRFQGVAHGGLS